MAGRGRARTVISPPLPPKATKPRPEPAERAAYAVRPGVRYRVRLLADDMPPIYGDVLDALKTERDELRAAGVPVVLEELRGAAYGRVMVGEPASVRQLVADHLAREVTLTLIRPDGSPRDDTRVEISPRGQALLNTPRAEL